MFYDVFCDVHVVYMRCSRSIHAMFYDVFCDVCRITRTPRRGVNRPVKIQLKPKSNSPAALPHLQERFVHSSKSTQQNLDRVDFLASCRVVDHRLIAESGGNTTHK